jgi:hypothetical protein
VHDVLPLREIWRTVPVMVTNGAKPVNGADDRPCYWVQP